MDKKIKKTGNNETSRHGINQFIIECMFNKYFEEEKDKIIVEKREKIVA